MPVRIAIAGSTTTSGAIQKFGMVRRCDDEAGGRLRFQLDQEHVYDALELADVPKKLLVVAALPVTARGKIDTRALQAMVF